MREIFIEKNFRQQSIDKIHIVNSILREYQADNYDLSLRQLYYQMVARGYIENSQKSYNRLGELVNDGRLAGFIDWDMIKDRGRETISLPHWKTPGDIIKDAAKQFALDKWIDQPNYIEVMVEKQALEGVLIPVCNSLDIKFTANKGYSSASALYETGQRLYKQLIAGKNVYILYLGDHDPSGIDMTRDIYERLSMFSHNHIEVKRLALNMDQIRVLQPPENPAKETDSRYSSYIEKYGLASWELDAIEPRALARIVIDAVEALLDPKLWDLALNRENEIKKELAELASNYQG